MSYTPQPGTLAYRVIRHFQALPEDAQIAAVVLAEQMNTNPHGIRLQLLKAVEDGFLCARYGVHNGRRAVYYSEGEVRLPANSASEDGDMMPSQRAVAAATLPAFFAFHPQREAAAFSLALTSDGRLIFQRAGRTVLELTTNETRALVALIDGAAFDDPTHAEPDEPQPFDLLNGLHRDPVDFQVSAGKGCRIVFERYGRIVLELTGPEAKLTADWLERNLSAFVPKQAEVAA